MFYAAGLRINGKHHSPKTGSQWDLSTGHAFECNYNNQGSDRLAPERELIKAFMAIGKRLTAQPTKEAKTHRSVWINLNFFCFKSF